MLRITRKGGVETLTLYLEGRISSGWLSVLEFECRESLQTGKTVEIDFGGVTAVDGPGLELVRQLESHGARVVNCKELIRDLLQQEGTLP